MKKHYTVFKVNKETGVLQDMNWTRHENEDDAIKEAMEYNYVELLVLPIYIPTKKN